MSWAKVGRGMTAPPRTAPSPVFSGASDSHFGSHAGSVTNVLFEREQAIQGRAVSTPSIQLQRSLYGDAGFRGPRALTAPANWAGEASMARHESVRLMFTRAASRELLRRGAEDAQDKSLDRTPQEVVLLRKLDRLKELRCGIDSTSGTQWTPRGQHRSTRTDREEGTDLSAEIDELLRRTRRWVNLVFCL